MDKTELVSILQQQSIEIANAGHNGWGNTMSDAAQTISAQQQQIAVYREAWINKAAELREEAGRIRRTVKQGTGAEERCNVRAEIYDKCAEALAQPFDTSALDRYRDEVLNKELSRDVLWQIDRKAFIKIMVDKFLGWKLPEHFHPDCGIVFTKRHSIGTQFESNYEPAGTNLFSASQAEEMFDHCFPDTVEVNERRMKKG